jgi:hypothetical protein
MDYLEDVHTLLLSERQALYPLGTQVATETIRNVLIQDGYAQEALTQMTAVTLRQMLEAEAALAGYQDIFFLFAALTLISLGPVLLMRGGISVMTSTDGAEATTGKQRRAKTPLHTHR